MVQLRDLFKPIKIGNVELKNRIKMPALHLVYAANNRITDRLRDFYIARAKGGVGLIGFALSPYSAKADPESIVPGSLVPGIYDDQLIPHLRDFTDLLHSLGVKVNAQMGAGYSWCFGKDTPEVLISPSGISMVRSAGAPRPRAVTVFEIHQMVDEFGEAARRAREAGFDAVEFISGPGYLLSQFLCPVTNQRTDDYGGSPENRARFLLEIIESARSKAGSDYTLMWRLAGEHFVDGGYTLEDTMRLAPMLERAGIHAIELTPGWHEDPVPMVTRDVPQGAWVYQAEAVKKVVNIPVSAGTRIYDPVFANQVIAEGRADLVFMARALITDPELPNKAREGRFEDIIPCTGCAHCFDLLGMPTECSVNPRTGREGEYTIEPATKSKKIFIVGGGPAGMEAARVAALRGHRVTLAEKENRLGGQLLAASKGPYKADINRLTEYLTNQVEKAGVQVTLGSEVTVEFIQKSHPDEVIVAAGATPIIPDIPGVDGDNVATAFDVLTGRREVEERVVIIGGEMVGCEVAEYLSEKGKKVTLLARRNRVGDDIGRATRWVLIQRLKQAGIMMETKVNVTKITDKGVEGVRDGLTQFFEGDSVVLAVGMRSDTRLIEELKGKVEALHVIGDCAEPRWVKEAINEGFKVAREI